jgi:hypothetical protein
MDGPDLMKREREIDGLAWAPGGGWGGLVRVAVQVHPAPTPTWSTHERTPGSSKFTHPIHIFIYYIIICFW